MWALPRTDRTEWPRRLLAFDLEATSLDARGGRIVAAGGVPLDDGTVVWGEGWETDVDDARPNALLEGGALATHLILPDRARAGLPLAALIERLADVVAEGRVLLVHGASIERRFLAQVAPKRRWPMLDTLAYLRAVDAVRAHVVDRLPRTSRGGVATTPLPTALTEARRFFGLPDYPPHVPRLDALAAAELYLLLSRRFPEMHPRVQD
jgi:DNA polymerase III epsilon subunit-like protein